jgi:uncharacterized membrane protein YdjX (TVP38/TMEM64 family)
MTNRKAKTRFNLKKWLISGSVLLLVAVLLYWRWQDVQALVDFLRDREALSAFLEQIGVWGPVVYVLLLGLQVVTAILPPHGLMVAAGYLYGFWGGLALNVLGAVIFSQLAFTISRYLGQDFVNRVTPATIRERWQDVIKRQGVFFFTLAFWFPIIPSNITNYIAGVSPISFLGFFLASFVGRLPGLALVTAVGAFGFELTPQQWLMVGIVFVLLIVGGRIASTKIESYYLGRTAEQSSS